MNHSSYRLHWRADGSWLVARNNVTRNNVTRNNAIRNNASRDNIYKTATLKPGSVVTPYFASLNFVFENKEKQN